MRLVAIVSNVLLARVRILLYKWKANWSSFDFLDRLDRKTFIQKMTWLRGISRWMKANRRNLHTRSRKLRKICHFHVDRFIFMLSISLIFSSSKVIREKPASIIFNDFKINNVGNQKSNAIQIIKQNELRRHAVLYLSVNNQDCMDNNRNFFFHYAFDLNYKIFKTFFLRFKSSKT